MNNYCGFIEVWGVDGSTNQSRSPLVFDSLDDQLEYTKKWQLKTVAIFKIKLDGGYNKLKIN